MNATSQQKNTGRKATHTGECQSCGSRQMLPGGVLAKHGYTTKWGFFSGVCAGSGHGPFETHTDRIAGQVAAVEREVAATAAEVAALKDEASEANNGSSAWVSRYSAYLGYHWVRADIEVSCFTIPASGSEPERNVYSAKSRVADGKSEKITNYDFGSSSRSDLRYWVHYCNSTYAERHLLKLNASRRDWLKWQAGRLAGWKQRPLADRQGKISQSASLPVSSVPG